MSPQYVSKVNKNYNIYTSTFNLSRIVPSATLYKVNSILVKANVADPDKDTTEVKGFGYLSKDCKVVTGPNVFLADETDIKIPNALCYNTGGGDTRFVSVEQSEHRISAQFAIGTASTFDVSDILMYNSHNLQKSRLDALLVPALQELKQATAGRQTPTVTCTCKMCSEVNVPIPCNADFIALPLFHLMDCNATDRRELFAPQDFIQSESHLMNLAKLLFTYGFNDKNETTGLSLHGHHYFTQSLIEHTMEEATNKGTAFTTFLGLNIMQSYRITASDEETPAVLMIKKQINPPSLNFFTQITSNAGKEKPYWVLSTKALYDLLQSLIALKKKTDILFLTDRNALNLTLCSRTTAVTLSYEIQLELELFAGISTSEQVMSLLQQQVNVKKETEDEFTNLNNTVIIFP